MKQIIELGDQPAEEKTAGPFGGAPTVRHCTDGGDSLSAQSLQTC